MAGRVDGVAVGVRATVAVLRRLIDGGAWECRPSLPSAWAAREQAGACRAGLAAAVGGRS